ncbi:antibiotic biosynthesis monooxygenase [Streptomyces sp. NBC_00237]|uniref:antibiotic biosynthesis monooxygenase n=1 Tax=Streptomyces sp. NBC_00237 TaxID=2975687 RepID=UPI002250753F|nr:antibiotic biosynthesis monooxygenase [Streptomyces sp. NBC_00237]MCX5205522.1 antibiotic biosynthesis monooxygenase [Streptomyces sp. NBC_00237]
MPDAVPAPDTTVLTPHGDVALIAARTVEPGHEEKFRTWALSVLAAAGELPGNLGGGLFRPAAADAPWIVVHRFRDRAALRTWLDSPQRAAHFADVSGHRHHEVARRELTGMEAWFTTPDRPAPGPPRWKMAASSALGILPISLLGSTYLMPHLTALPDAARTAVFAPLFSVLMTYVSMPLVTRLLRRWLHPACPADGSRTPATRGPRACPAPTGEARRPPGARPGRVRPDGGPGVPPPG